MTNLNRFTPFSTGNGPRLILFTGVDGTLLDDETYAADTAATAVEMLAEQGIPLIFCSSKTFAEQEYLQKKLGIRAPFIFENGSAVAIPQGYFPEGAYQAHGFWGDYDVVVFANSDAYRVRSVVERLNRLYGWSLRGFGDCAEPELSQLTHLAGDPLERARDRMFTEILVNPMDSAKAGVLNRHLEQAGLSLSKNARFNSVQSIGIDKSVAMRWLRKTYAAILFREPKVAAIGDSANDAAMLAAADYRFLVQRPGPVWAPLCIEGLEHVDAVGPAGFRLAVDTLSRLPVGV